MLPSITLPEAEASWGGFVDFLGAQRRHCHANHQRWKDLPSHLLEQVQDFILPVEQLVDLSAPPHLIHADLTSDHLIGRFDPTAALPTIEAESITPATTDWQSLAIIDWGDARIGNILYELVALHLDLFQADTHLLQICLEAYDLPYFYRQDFTTRALSMVLLHQFPMPALFMDSHPAVHTLRELADCLFAW
jgi:hypothetical protein